MIKARYLMRLSLLCLFLLPQKTHSQGGTQNQGQGLESFKKSMRTLLGDSTLFQKVMKDLGLLKNPETLNKIWKSAIVSKSRILKDLNLEFKTFKANANDSTFGFGCSYSFARDVAMRQLSETGQSGISLSFSAKGNVAFEKESNPSDFLDSKFSFHLYKSWHNTVQATPEYYDLLDSLGEQLAGIKDKAQFLASPVLKEYVQATKRLLKDQFYLDFSAAGGLESNQDFSKKQYTYGIVLGVDLKPRKNGHLNIFDWPFASIRWLNGYDDELAPLGETFPTVLVSLERVDTRDDKAGRMLGDSANFTRFRTEIAFKTPLSSASFFESNLRYYKRLHAPSAIKQARLDEQLYFTAALIATNGLYVSYATGKLPFDAKDDQIYEIGLRYNF